MVRITSGPIIVALLGCLGAAALGLTTYTLPIEGAASDPELRTLLSAALRDSSVPLPLASSVLPLQSTTPANLAAPSVPESRDSVARSDASIADEAHAWVTAAAAADPAALRAWLGRWVWASAVTDGDTVRLTLHRLSRHPGCPWLNSLTATSARSTDYHTRLIRVTATCPANVK